MSRQIQIRRGTTAENDAFTGAEGEITCDTQTHELRVHDGLTQGGHVISTKNNFYSKSEIDTVTVSMANSDLNNLTNTGKTVCANMAMPSNRYTNLTLGASGSSYTAPADGYYQWSGATTGGNGYFRLFNTDSSIGMETYNNNSGYGIIGFIPVRKGNTVGCSYERVNITQFRFVYANGAQ